MLPAAHGDALWIQYGSSRSPHHVLIDAGPANTYDDIQTRLTTLNPKRREIELLVITHIDTDHIDGSVLALQDARLNLICHDIWFNGWQHLAAGEERDALGPEQGEFLQALIDLRNRPWNQAFGSGPVCVLPSGSLPVKALPDGFTVTLLSPGERQLRRLRRNWESVVADAGWDPGDASAALRRLAQRKNYLPPVRLDHFGEEPFGSDNAIANGSSIAFVVDFDGKRCLLTGDAHTDVLAAGLDRYRAMHPRELGRGPIQFDVVKLPHHGSKNNWEPDLQRRLTSRRYLVSTSGARFRHPDRQTLDLILEMERPSPELFFNYFSDTTKAWADPTRQKREGFTAHYPSGASSGITVTLD